MRCLVVVALVLAWEVTEAAGQFGRRRPEAAGRPGQPAPALSAAATGSQSSLFSATKPEALIRFDPLSVEVRRYGDRWQLRAGQQVIKDFGTESDARQALNLIRTLRLTHYGAIGSPQPVLEYWLADGKVPPPLRTSNPPLEFDPTSLRLEQLHGQWFVRDDRQPLFCFGAHAAEARQALEVLQKYGFNQAYYVGQPLPALMYLSTSQEKARPVPGPMAFSGLVQKSPALTDPRATLLQVQSRQLSMPPLTPESGPAAGTRSALTWQLVLGTNCLADFGPHEREARAALWTLQNPRFVAVPALGRPARAASCFLVNNQHVAPGQANVVRRRFRPESLSVGQRDGHHVLVENDRVVLDLGSDAEHARQVLQLIQRFGLNQLTQVGTNADVFYILGRER